MQPSSCLVGAISFNSSDFTESMAPSLTTSLATTVIIDTISSFSRGPFFREPVRMPYKRDIYPAPHSLRNYKQPPLGDGGHGDRPGRSRIFLQEHDPWNWLHVFSSLQLLSYSKCFAKKRPDSVVALVGSVINERFDLHYINLTIVTEYV